MPIEMIAPRNYTLRTKLGHTIKFLAGQGKLVPDSAVSEALAVNILPVENSDLNTADLSGAGVQQVQIGGLLRVALVVNAIADLVKENNVENFDGGGRPKVAVMNQMTGLSLSAKERSEGWDRFRELKNSGEDMPTHKAMDTVIALQRLNTPNEFKEYAELLDVPESKLLGLNAREQKQLLLAAAIK